MAVGTRHYPAFFAAQRAFAEATSFARCAAEIGFLFFATETFAAGASAFVPLTFAQRARWDAFILAIVSGERLPDRPSAFVAENAVAFAGAGVPVKMEAISA